MCLRGSDKPAVEPLLASLKDESFEARRYKGLVIESLGEIGDQRAVGPIIIAMREKSELQKLSGIIDPFMENPWLSSRNIDPFWKYSAKALGKLTGQRFGTNVKQWEAWWAQNKAKKEAPKTEAPQ